MIGDNCDIAIIGGAMMGSSIAWWLSHFQYPGKITVIEMDPSYKFSSTSATNSCIRQQFGSEINTRISQFGAEFIKEFRSFMGEAAPQIPIRNFGYLYLADSKDAAETLRQRATRQQEWGAGTQILTPETLAEKFPFYNLEGILLASHNTQDEGYFDGGTIFDFFRNGARKAGAEYRHDRVIGMDTRAGKINALHLESGARLNCGAVVNAAGPRADTIMRMAGLGLPVEPRKRLTYVFSAAEALPCPLPLTIDPCGVHVRSDGAYYMAGAAPDDDSAVDPEDFHEDHGLWESKVWPALATRIPAFERIKLRQSWVGHYAYNVFDQNAILGQHPEIKNLFMANGFSGHGLQQAPAVGRGLAELLIHGSYQTLDLGPLGIERLSAGQRNIETNVI